MSLSTRPAGPGPLLRDKRPYRCLSASLATEAASLSTRPANPGPRRLHGQSAGRADLDGVCVVGGQAFAGMAGGGNRTCCAAGRSRPPRFITAGAGQEYPLAAFARSGIRVSAAYSWSLEVARGETRRGARETPSALCTRAVTISSGSDAHEAQTGRPPWAPRRLGQPCGKRPQQGAEASTGR